MTAPERLDLRRIGLVVHPSRALERALASIRSWAAEHGAQLAQVPVDGQVRDVAPPAAAEDCDVVLALGGDGTTLAALRAASASARPVLGVACGSLGALTSVPAAELRTALDAVAAGRWSPRRLPGAAVALDGADPVVALNDLVVVRAGASQIAVAVRVDGELYVRFAGDGLVVATPLGSSAYTLAAGGPVVEPDAGAVVLTPVAPHGGCCPPLVAGSQRRLTIDVEPSHGGMRVELDGHVVPTQPRRLEVAWRPAQATLIAVGDTEPFLTALRRRRILIDSPRVLARDEREPRAPVTER